MKKQIKEIIGIYDLSDTITKPLNIDLEGAFLKWWERQASELTQELLRKELRIKSLENRINKRKRKQ